MIPDINRNEPYWADNPPRELLLTGCPFWDDSPLGLALQKKISNESHAPIAARLALQRRVEALEEALLEIMRECRQSQQIDWIWKRAEAALRGGETG